jgi:hypothetical protein
MANLFEASDATPLRFVPISSRYAETPVVYYTENKILTFATYKKVNIPMTERDRYYVVTPGTEYRPDLVSKSIYGTPDFWWKIMEANNIIDIFKFKAGLNIRLPDSILR